MDKDPYLRKMMNRAFAFAITSLCSQQPHYIYEENLIAIRDRGHHLVIIMNEDFFLYTHDQGPLFVKKDLCTRYYYAPIDFAWFQILQMNPRYSFETR